MENYLNPFNEENQTLNDRYAPEADLEEGEISRNDQPVPSDPDLINFGKLIYNPYFCRFYP